MNDYISRQAAIEAIDRYYKDKRYTTRSRTILSAICRDMKSTMDSLPSEQPEQKWIPCSERLPEPGEYYFVTRQYFGWNCTEYREIDIAKYDSDGWHKGDDTSSITVLAWCELDVLKPWEGEEHGET